ncbi:MAG: DUF86 domain-containing protein [Flavobacteriales bacterium]|nr:DUF86 domain-containing protein [Flavobacteriales bacterium]
MKDKSLHINKLLFDILSSINLIEEFLGENREFEVYESNKMLKNAVERNLEIIGEATNKLLKIDSNIQISNARRIVDTRNKIIHGYDEIEDVNIWVIIINYIPILKSEVTKLLDTNQYKKTN